MKRARISPILLVVALAAGPLFAGPQARVVGKVTDGKGAPLGGVKITVTTPAITNFKQTLTTDKEGNWGTILNDSTLKYHYKFEKEGFIAVEQDKKIPIGTTESLDVQLLTQGQAVEKGVIKQTVDPFTAAYNDAVDKLQQNDLDGALAKAIEATTIAPTKANGFELAAKIAARKKDWDKVIEFGEKSLALEPDNPSLFGLLAEGYRVKGNKAKAAEWDKKFIEANPDQPDVLYNQAVEFYNKGKFKEAMPILKKVVEVKPDYANAHFLLGMSAANLGDVALVRKHLAEYLQLEPKGKDASSAKEMLDAYK